MKQENHFKWNNTPLTELPTNKIKNILKSNFTYCKDMNKNRILSLNNNKLYFGLSGVEVKQLLQNELFKRRLNYNLNKKIHDNKELHKQINKLFIKIFK